MSDAPPDLHQMLLDAGLGRVADVIEREARPSIRLTAHPVAYEAEIPLGASKLGGSPDLPPGFDWPRHDGFPLAFIAQINLADAALYDVEKLLPPTGLLHFFFTYDRRMKEPWPPKSSMWRVQFTDDAPSLQRVPMPPPLPERKDEGPYEPATLTFASEVTFAGYLPYFHNGDHRGLQAYAKDVPEFSEAEREAYYGTSEAIQGRAHTKNRTLGHPDAIQHLDLQPDHVLLLQVDSEEGLGMMWGDVGRLYWWMDREALLRRDFSHVKFDEQCS